jgi:hypothetical protein
LKKYLLFLLLLCCFITAFTQEKQPAFVAVSGTVYDITARRPLEAVAVLSTSGRGTITDSLGHYSFVVRSTDSIWFAMLGKTTMKYAIDTIKNLSSFDISILLRAAELPEVKVRNSFYKLDSLQNRQDYAKYFNYRKPGIRLNTDHTYNPGGVSVGLDLDEIINMFRFKYNKRMLALQQRLVQQEQDKYIDHRYTKLFVRKITKLNSPELDTFMVHYRPTYDFLQTVNDLELGYFIEKCFENYKLEKRNKGSLRKNDNE